MSPTERRKLAAGVNEAVQRVTVLSATYRAGVSGAVAAQELRLSGPCPVKQPGLSPLYMSAKAGTPVPASRLLEQTRETVRALRKGAALAKGTVLVDLEGHRRYELVLRIEQQRNPVTLGARFVPGMVKGRALLWDYQAGRIVCGGEIVATSSGKVSAQVVSHPNSAVVLGVGGSVASANPEAVKAALQDDLRRGTQKAIWSQMKAIAPK